VIILCILFFSCNSEDAPDCLQVNGDRETRTYSVGSFTKIRIEDNVDLRIRQGNEIDVRVEAGGNLFTDISVEVYGNTLVVSSDNNCELLRDYEPIVAYVTAPDIDLLRNASTGDVISEGVLRYTNLELRSDTSGGLEDPKKSGDFRLQLDTDDLFVEGNGFSGFYLSGSAKEAYILFTDEIPLFEGAELEIEDLTIFQRSANIMRVNPINSIRGSIRGTGDVIAVNRPEIVEVDAYYTGRLIFED
jgi:hypothetical protein